MSSGIVKLLEILQEIWGTIKPYCAVKAWEQGVILRFGRFQRILIPGYYFKIPIFELAVIHTVVLQSARGPIQTIANEHFRWTLKYQIVNIEKYVCEIADEVNFLRDVVTANIAQYKTDRKNGDTWNNMMKRLREEASEGGFKIEKLRLVDMVEGRSYRLFGDQGEIE